MRPSERTPPRRTHLGSYASWPGWLFAAAVLGGCTVPVAAGLEEGDANRVVVALDHAGIDAAKEADPTVEGRFRVTVAHDDASRALVTMGDEQLPRAKAKGILDAAEHGQLVPSQAAEHAQLVAGLAGELERTIANVEGVLAARVHLNLPPRDGLRDGPPMKATASVLVEHRGSTPPLATESVQRLVAGGAPGLVPGDVAVVFVAHAARPASSRPDVAHVGPIAVARGSMNTLKAALAGLALLVLVLAGTSLALYARIARLRREQLEGERQQQAAVRDPRQRPTGAP
ncbi:MAG: Type secretion bridge between inner and outerrane lipoprotein [Labilithrix sp.]|nr:Type secretion bridge between inner and outerrane lipoprotein [Labilithrix sp.]